ncbi:hypothetical protein ACOIWS_004884 [Salmonella enterica]
MSLPDPRCVGIDISKATLDIAASSAIAPMMLTVLIPSLLS